MIAPSFLCHWEPSFNLAKEEEVNAALRELQITRVIIAHRPETIAAADRVLRLEGGLIGGNAAERALLTKAGVGRVIRRGGGATRIERSSGACGPSSPAGHLSSL